MTSQVHVRGGSSKHLHLSGTCRAPVYLPIWLSSLSIWQTAQGAQHVIVMQSLQMEPSTPNISLILVLSVMKPPGTQNGMHMNSPTLLDSWHRRHGMQHAVIKEPLMSSMQPVIGVLHGRTLAWVNVVVTVRVSDILLVLV